MSIDSPSRIPVPDESAAMTRLSTLPSHREQAHHALVLLGVPAPARLVAEVHGALFDGDLSVPALAALLRDEQRRCGPAAALRPDAPATAVRTGEAGRPGGTERRPYVICPGLQPDLTAARGHLTLSTWPVADRIRTPAAARAEALVATVRIAEFVAMRPGRSAARLLRQLAEAVPGGPETLDVAQPGTLADAARAALADPALAAAVTAEAPVRTAAARRAARLDEQRRLFGVPGLPQQRDGA